MALALPAKPLRSARQAKRLGLADVAGQTGIGKAVLRRLEFGATNPRLRTIDRHAKAVGERLTVRLADR